MLKGKILNKEKTIGTHVNIADVSIGKIAGLSGYDFVWLDFEHGYMDYETLLAQIIAVQGTGTPVVVRAPQHDLTATKKIVEMGPDGIIFPMVRNAAEVEELLSMTLYPPYGTRGFAPMNAIDYGFSDVLHYVRNNHREMCRFIQLEHKEAIDDLENIMKLEYLDGYIFGPNDLSGSIKEMLDVFGKNTTELMKRAIAMLKRENKYIGLSTGDISEETIRYWHDMGIDMLSVGSDYDLLRRMMVQNSETLTRIHKQG